MAKGIGGGFPIGGLITFGEASSLFTKGQHGSTFGGNPLATAVANAVSPRSSAPDSSRTRRAAVTSCSERILAIGSPLVHGVRGRGLLIGVALPEPVAGHVVAAAMRGGLIVNAANDSTIRLAPPLIIGDAEVDEFIARFTAASPPQPH